MKAADLIAWAIRKFTNLKASFSVRWPNVVHFNSSFRTEIYCIAKLHTIIENGKMCEKEFCLFFRFLFERRLSVSAVGYYPSANRIWDICVWYVWHRKHVKVFYVVNVTAFKYRKRPRTREMENYHLFNPSAPHTHTHTSCRALVSFIVTVCVCVCKCAHADEWENGLHNNLK